ncbi:MAG: hypothetical protein JNL05_04295 [Flavobacteriales bacterium]|nr:hypothetical protein [Flavobacteriales bacterium]
MRPMHLLLLPLLLLGSGCAHAPLSADELATYAADPEHGLLRKRTVSGITTTVRLVPPALAAQRMHLGQGEDMRKQLTVVVNIAPDMESYKGDVMRAGATDRVELFQQAFDLNFNWEEMIELRCGSRSYAPVLSTLENTYGLSRDRNVVLVFVPEHADDRAFYDSPEIELVLTDHVLGTGIQHFRFERKALLNVPPSNA